MTNGFGALPIFQPEVQQHAFSSTTFSEMEFERAREKVGATANMP
jgi:hypothetical protein